MLLIKKIFPSILIYQNKESFILRSTQRIRYNFIKAALLVSFSFSLHVTVGILTRCSKNYLEGISDALPFATSVYRHKGDFAKCTCIRNTSCALWCIFQFLFTELW